jgi:hypothetical protein
MKRFLLILTSILIPACACASAQSLLGKSQILIAYESKAAFLGEVVYIGDPPGGFSTYGSTSQTLIFKIRKVFRGRIDPRFVAVRVAVTGDLRGSVFENDLYIVLLSDYSGVGNSGSCGEFEFDSKNDKFKILAGNKRSFSLPCYHVDQLNNILEGSEKEIAAITDYFKFLDSRR